MEAEASFSSIALPVFNGNNYQIWAVCMENLEALDLWFSLIKKVSFLLIPLRSLTCHKSNLFKRTYDFSVRQTTTLDIQWRVSYHLKGLLWPNINWNKIGNIKKRLNVLTKCMNADFN